MSEATKGIRLRVTTAFVRRGASIQAALKLYRAVFFAAAAAIAGAMQFWGWKPSEQPTVPQIIGICATFVVFVASLVSIVAEKDSSNELALAQEAINRAQDVEESYIKLAAEWPDTDRMIALYQITKIMRDALEQASVAMTGDDTTLVSNLLALSAKSIRVATGFSLGDEWTICAFRAELAEDGIRYQLRLVAHDRTTDCPIDEARVWPEGVGVAGVAFSHKHELLVPDLALDAIRAIFQPEGLRRPYDDDRYRSIVAVPVLVADSAIPWGVITATSDRVAHFNHDDQPGLKPEEAIRALADYTALAVAHIEAVRRAHQPAPLSA